MRCPHCGEQWRAEQVGIGPANLELWLLDPRRRLMYSRERWWGTPIRRIRTRNKIPQSGRDIVRELLARSRPGTGLGFAPVAIALGTGSTAPSDGDTALVTEVYRDEITTRQGFTNKVTYQLFLDTEDGNGNTFREAGLFDASAASAGQMLARATFTAVAKTSSIQLIVTWDINIAST